MHSKLIGLLAGTALTVFCLVLPSTASSQIVYVQPLAQDRSSMKFGLHLDGLEVVQRSDWNSSAVRRVLQAFAPYQAMLIDDLEQLSPLGLYLTWARAMHTRGCNLFLHKTAFYLTNYHAAIHVQNAGVGLIRDYYDDTVKALMDYQRKFT